VNPFSGLIRYLTNQSGQNVCDGGIVSMKVAHTNPVSYQRNLNGGDVNVVFDLDSRVGSYDRNENPTWLQIDFQNHRVHIASYSISFGVIGPSNAKRWVLEGSNDGSSWTMIDDRSSEQSCRSEFEIGEFDCQSRCSDAFQYLRLTKKGACWGSGHCFGLAALEFFGTITAVSRGTSVD
jgi:hypothetical protein